MDPAPRPPAPWALACAALCACAPLQSDGRVELADEGGEARVGCETTWPGGETGTAGAAHAAPWGDDGNPGTAEAPYATLGRAVRAASGKALPLVLLAEGEYAAAITQAGPLPLHIQGACTEGVVLRPPGPGDPSAKRDAAIRVTGGALRLTDLTVAGGEPGVEVTETGRLELRRVVVRDAVRTGIDAVREASLDLRQVRVQDIRSHDPRDRAIGIRVRNRATLFAHRLELLRVEGHGLFAGGPSSVELDTVLVADGVAPAIWAAGLRIACGDFRARNVDILDQPSSGVNAHVTCGHGARIDLQELRIVGTRHRPEVDEGKGIQLKGEYVAELRSVAVRRARVAGIQLRGGRASLRDVLIEGTRQAGQVGTGRGLSVSSGARARVRGLVSAYNQGPGLSSLGGGRIELGEALLLGNRTAGAAVAGGELRAWDTRFEDTRPGPSLGGGVGLWLGPNASAELTGCSFTGLASTGVYAHGYRRLAVRGSRFLRNGRGGQLPGGILAARGTGPLVVTDSVFRHLGGDGILLDGAGAVLERNRFAELEGEPLWRQDCADGGLDATEQAEVDGRCRDAYRETTPYLAYREGREVDEVDVEDED